METKKIALTRQQKPLL
uniref:Uncharacterized protein n=1 Tax=Rhizophora mucronata TaxID=61149 RepID=A0A2P2JHA0_RHIMU